MGKFHKTESTEKILNIWQYIKPWHVLLILIIVNVILGLLIGDQYGQTWDEPSFYLYGERSFDAYMNGIAGRPLIPEKHIYFLDLRYYGAFYAAMGWKVVEIFRSILKNWDYIDIWHFVNFVFFQISIITLYFLAKRYLRPWTTILVVVLFNTQPLLFGHAFINPKDVPFMTFFLLSVTTGLYMVDAIKENEAFEKLPPSFPLFDLLFAILVGLFVLAYVCKDVIGLAVSHVILFMYNAPNGTFLNDFFSLLIGSSSRLPVENYIHKAVSAHLERSVIYLLFFILMGRKIYLLRLNTQQHNWHINYRLLLMILAAGLALGFATAIRLLAPFAGLIIVCYALYMKGRLSFPSLIYYFSAAVFVAYLAWPFLWDSPTFHYLEALQVMRDFPYTAEVRFMGDNIAPSDLPWYYIPFLISAQITIPVVLLAWVGFGGILFDLKNFNAREKLLVPIWLALPIGLQIILRSNVYDNFRQFLFVLPPIFVLTGMGFEIIIKRIYPRNIKFVLAVLSTMPGIVSIVALHPIQYIYYNGLVGGVSGAEGDFELDYWLTSYREASTYINDHASQGANILAWGSGYNGARDDLNIYSFSSDDDIKELDQTFEYAVISTRFSSHLNILKGYPIVYEIRRNGALLSVVRKLDQ